MPNPATVRERRLRKTKAQLIDEIDALEQRVAALDFGREQALTERKQAEQEFAEKEALLRTALDNMPGGIALEDRDRNYVLFNSQYGELHDYPEGFLKVGMPAREEARFQADRGDFGPGNKDELVEEVLNLDQGGKTTSWERTLTDGRTLSFNSAPTPGGGLAQIVTDITERKRAEEALRESQQFLGTLVDSIPAVVFFRDLEGRYIRVNHKYEEVFQVTDESVRGKTLYDVFPKDRADDFTAYDREAVEQRRVLKREETLVVQGVEHVFDSLKFPILDASGEVVAVGGVDYDITDRKRAEQALAEKEAQLRVALDNMPGGIALEDRDRNYVLFNSQYSELFELPDGLVRVGGSIRDELRFQADRGDFGPGDKNDLIEQVIATYQRGEAVSFERAIAGSGGTLQVYMAPTPEGGYVTIVTDITDRKRAEEELAAANGIIKDQKERMESELNVGRDIQMSFVPDFSSLPDHDEFSIYAALEPAREVGGDFYDCYFLDRERFCFCIADVSGKGVPAALFMAMAKTLIKSRAADDRSTASILTHVNDELSADNQACMFVTVFAGILNIRSGELVYTNAGHNPPYLRRKDGTLQRLDQRHGPAIGAMEGMVYKEERDTLEPGDLLFLYTDGVTEAIDTENHLFSEDRLKDLLTAKSTKDVQTAVDHTVAAVRAFEGEAEQTDDITVLALEFHGRPEDALRAE
jgi:PAS domain S-box-containing protein